MDHSLKEIWEEIQEVYEETVIIKHTIGLVDIFKPLSKTERQRELFKRKLKGELIDPKLLEELLQEQTHESKSN